MARGRRLGLERRVRPICERDAYAHAHKCDWRIVGSSTRTSSRGCQPRHGLNLHRRFVGPITDVSGSWTKRYIGNIVAFDFVDDPSTVRVAELVPGTLFMILKQ